MLDHDAIYKAYPNVVTISDDVGALDKDRNKVALEKSKIDAARTTLNAEKNAVQYKTDRLGGEFPEEVDSPYPTIGDQLDLLYKDIVAGTVTTSGGFATQIKATKDKHPKP